MVESFADHKQSGHTGDKPDHAGDSSNPVAVGAQMGCGTNEPEDLMAFPGGTLATLLHSVVVCSQHIMSLPAVPTRDWCDKASEVLAPLAPAGMAVVMLGTIDAKGRVLEVEQVGVSAAQSAGRSDRITSALRALKTRTNRLASVGFDPSCVSVSQTCVDTTGTCAAGLISTLPEGRNWHTGAIGRLLQGVVDAEPVVGIAALPVLDETSKSTQEQKTHRVIFYVLTSFTSQIDPIHSTVARTLMPSLATRAMLAFGSLRGSSGGFLTPRESEVLERLVGGASIREIADELGRSQHTVHDYVKSLHRKLGANSRGELVALALGHDPASGVYRGRLATVEPKPLPKPVMISHASDSCLGD